MHPILSAALVGLLSVSAGAVAGSSAALEQRQPEVANLGAVLEEVRAKSGVPGLVGAAVRDGKIVAIGAAGVRQIGTDDRVTIDDPFLIGSCTKAMTRALAALLTEKSVFAFDMTLEQALPGVAMHDQYRAATLSDVMRHTAGLPGYERITPRETPIVFEVRGTPRECRAQFAAHVLMENPAGPRGKFTYSNAGFSILGHIMERRTDKAWEDLMVEEVFKPLKMESVGFGRSAEKTGVPLGHRRTADGFAVARSGPPLTGTFAPAGGVRVPIRDFARFVAAQAGGFQGLLKKETAAALSGLGAADGAGVEGAAIFGGEGLFNAGFAVWPSKGFGIAVCTNAGDADDACQAAIDAIRRSVAPDVGTDPPAARGKLGIRIQAEADGAWSIDSVEAGSPAEKAGLRAGDEFVAIDGTPLAEIEPPARAEALRAPRVSITVRRDGKDIVITIDRSAEPGG